MQDRSAGRSKVSTRRLHEQVSKGQRTAGAPVAGPGRWLSGRAGLLRVGGCVLGVQVHSLGLGKAEDRDVASRALLHVAEEVEDRHAKLNQGGRDHDLNRKTDERGDDPGARLLRREDHAEDQADVEAEEPDQGHACVQHGEHGTPGGPQVVPVPHLAKPHKPVVSVEGPVGALDVNHCGKLLLVCSDRSHALEHLLGSHQQLPLHVGDHARADQRKQAG
mmetsp:Transcript_19306/g.74020  ORF Transcript_19306/g.74020 Transcript_19306/m.74020 type:complete len:220 (+) Transcript_19306:106-765(+)